MFNYLSLSNWKFVVDVLNMSDMNPVQINLAPIFANVILLGEVGKYTALSTYRFRSMQVTDSFGLNITVAGNVGETVQILWTLTNGTTKNTKSSDVVFPGPFVRDVTFESNGLTSVIINP